MLLLLCSRLSVEKRSGRALDALAVLNGLGVPATLLVAGDGPLRAGLESRVRAERLPVEFLGGTSGQLDRRADQALQGALAAVTPQRRHVAS